MNKVIIAFSGFKTSGKDSASDIVEEYLNLTEIPHRRNSGSDIVHAVTDEIFGTNWKKVNDKEKKIQSTKWIFGKNNLKSYRELMILIGENIKKFTSNNVWTQRLDCDIRKFFSENQSGVFIIPAIRYKSEFKMLHRFEKLQYDIYHFVIDRNEVHPHWYDLGLSPNVKEELEIIQNDFNEDHSEYEWLEQNKTFTDTIYNNGNLDDLKREVLDKIISKIS